MSRIAFARHAPIDCFDILGDELAIGGLPLSRLAARVGRTPFYAYSRQAIIGRVAALRQALPPAVKLHYAMKANPMPAVVGLLAGLTDGLDVASAGEMRVALDTGVSPRHVSFAGPGKSPAEIEQAVAAGITLNLESVRQYRDALAAGRKLAIAPRLAVRVNPAFELKSSGIRMGGGPKPFGIDEAQVPDLLARMAADGLDPVGLHIYSGSQNLDAAAITQAQRETVDLACRLAAPLRSPLEWVNIGGGFGVPYFPGDRPLALEPIGLALAPLAERVQEQLRAPLVLELGRYFVSEAGIYVARVVDRKVSQGQVFLVTDGGLHHNLAASGNFGQVIRKNYPVAIGNRIAGVATGTQLQVQSDTQSATPSNTRSETQSVVGPLCTPLDLLADRVDLPVAAVGDLVVVFMAGAYGPSASPVSFLSHPAPVEVLV